MDDHLARERASEAKEREREREGNEKGLGKAGQRSIYSLEKNERVYVYIYRAMEGNCQRKGDERQRNKRARARERKRQGEEGRAASTSVYRITCGPPAPPPCPLLFAPYPVIAAMMNEW